VGQCPRNEGLRGEEALFEERSRKLDDVGLLAKADPHSKEFVVSSGAAWGSVDESHRNELYEIIPEHVANAANEEHCVNLC
jgi:hypothetical protein